jgi:DNA-binding NtrC family response regulator
MENSLITDILKQLPRSIPMRKIEVLYTLMVLERNKGNRTTTALDIGVKLRTLRSKIMEYRIEGYDIPEHKPNGRPKKITSEA